MRNSLLIIITFFSVSLYAHIHPAIWYQSDSLITLPQEDSIAWTNETISDSLWSQWFSPEYDNNVEINEMRNEYLFCRIASNESCSFLSYMSSFIDNTTRTKVAHELQNPIHDGINLEMCVQRILSCHAIEEQFKKWLISQIKRQKEKLEELGYHEYTPEEYLQKYQESLDYLQKKGSSKQ